MTFDEFVEATIGKRPTFTRGHYSLECRAWDARYVQLLNGGSEVALPIYHPRRARLEAKERIHANAA